MEAVRKIIRVLNGIENWALVFVLFFMTGLAFLQIVLRNFFATGFAWADVLNRHLVLWIGFLGAGIATKEGRHINVDALSKVLPAKANHAIEIVIDAAASFICTLMAYTGWEFVAAERESGAVLFTAGGVEVMNWWLQLIIPFGFGLIAARLLIRAGLRVAEMATGKEYLKDLADPDAGSDRVHPAEEADGEGR